MPVSISGDGAITGLDLGDFEDVSGTPTDGQFLAWNSSTGKWEPTTMSVKEKRVVKFTANSTWTVPSGVTYAIAYVCGGGGGVGKTAPGTGGTSSAALTGGTISGPGGTPAQQPPNMSMYYATAGANNSGTGATVAGYDGSSTAIGGFAAANNAVPTIGGNAVTPGASITISVGAGGAAGTSGASGGSGWVAIEYYE